MRERGWMSRGALVVAGVCGAVVLTACGGGTNEGAESSTSAAPATTTGQTSAAPGTPFEVPDDAAVALCDMIRPELSNFRVQGPTLGRVGLNAMVHEWALRNGAINAQVLGDKAVIDRATTKACPDVRQEAIEALELKDLASGLVF